MKRLVFAVLLAWVLPVPLMAGGLGEKNCQATAGIIAVAIEARKAGQSPAAIKTRLSKGEEAVEPVYVATVGPLVDWVFQLEPLLLTTKMVADFKEQCLQY